MATNRRKKTSKEGLKGLDVQINAFGEVDFNLNLEDVNQFLNNNLEDPKLKHLQEKVQH